MVLYLMTRLINAFLTIHVHLENHTIFKLINVNAQIIPHSLMVQNAFPAFYLIIGIVLI